MDVNDLATLMFVSFCIIKSNDWSIDMAERTWLNEPYHDTLYNGLLVGPILKWSRGPSGKQLSYTRYRLHTTKNISPSPTLQFDGVFCIDVDQGSLIKKK